MSILLKRPDSIGVLASSFCLLHCLATPLLFFLPNCIGECESMAPIWWKQMDIFFLALSFWAVYQSTKTTSSIFIKPIMWVSWGVLSFLLFNEKFEGINLPEILTYLVALILVGLHLYNKKYCSCKKQ